MNDWRDDPATQEQLDYLEHLGVSVNHPLSQGEAQDLIDAAAASNDANYEKEPPTEAQIRRLSFYEIEIPLHLTKQEATDLIDQYKAEHPESEVKYQLWKVREQLSERAAAPPQSAPPLPPLRAAPPAPRSTPGSSRIWLLVLLIPVAAYLYYAKNRHPDHTTDAAAAADVKSEQTEPAVDSSTPAPAKIEATPAPPSQVAPTPDPAAALQEAQRVAIQRYPTLGVSGSVMNQRFLAKVRLYRQTKPEYFQRSDWPLRIADEVAAENK